MAVAACLIASLILVFGYRWPLLRSLSVVQAFGAGRYLLFVVFFMSVMVGVGTVTLIRLRSTHLPAEQDSAQAGGKGSNVFTFLLLAVMVDLGPATFQHPYPSKAPMLLNTGMHNSLQREAARYPNGELPNYRIFYATGNALYRLFVISWLPVKTGMASFLGVYNELPLSAFAFGRPLEKLLNSAIKKIENLKQLPLS